MREPVLEISGLYEPVLEISGFYDGPREGVAMLHGVPHYFKSRYLDAQEYSGDFESVDIFEVVPVSSPTTPPILAHAIFRAVPGQSDLRPGVFRKMEVVWRVLD